MKTYKIAIIGVESTGKSTLTEQLTHIFQTTHLTEYARKYLAKLKRQYGRMDVLHIGQQQFMRQVMMQKLIESMERNYQDVDLHKPFFYDTDLTVVKIWYETKYNKSLPEYLEVLYIIQDFDFYLLPYPNLEWKDDALRETPNLAERMRLFARYESELQKMNRPYHVVMATGEARTQEAESVIRKLWEV